MKNKQKGSDLIVVAVIVLLLIVSGTFFYSKEKKELPKDVADTPAVIPEVATTTNILKVEMSTTTQPSVKKAGLDLQAQHLLQGVTRELFVTVIGYYINDKSGIAFESSPNKAAYINKGFQDMRDKTGVNINESSYKYAIQSVATEMSLNFVIKVKTPDGGSFYCTDMSSEGKTISVVQVASNNFVSYTDCSGKKL